MPVCVTAMCLAAAGAATGQTLNPGPPGPYVIDLRGTTLGEPQAAAFYPVLPPAAEVPSRGFGIDAGAHVYPARLGPGRLGVGASVLHVRGSVTDTVSITTRVVAPQVSLNFGTSDGWSYIGGGIGVARVAGRLEASNGTPGATQTSGALLAINGGGGARWFFARHVAFGFDLRLHRLSPQEPHADSIGTPAIWLGSASVGLSFK
jgi:hypothetical protein